MTRFTCFPRLPTEMQLLIWKVAIEGHNEGRRIVMDRDGRVRPTLNLRCRFLVTCRASREAALSFYTMKLDVFLNKISIPLLPDVCAGTVYVKLHEGCTVYVASDPPLRYTTARLPTDLLEKLVTIGAFIAKLG